MSSRRGGRGGGRGGGGKELPREVLVSKKVSWLLRHGAEKEGLKLGAGGYVGVQDALNTRALKSLKVTFPELRELVASNDKQRFSLIPVSSLNKSATPAAATLSSKIETSVQDSPAATENPIPAFDEDEPSNYLIRANQGHSLKVDTEGLLTPITEANVPPVVVHGTDERAWKLILKGGGLRTMGRNHIHFAMGLPKGWRHIGDDNEHPTSDEVPAVETTADTDNKAEETANVISGMRSTSTILIYVDVPKAMAEGIKFWISENGVVLSGGDEQRCISSRFFKRVVDRRGEGKVLMRDGVVPEGTEVDEEAWRLEVEASRRGRGGGRGRGGRGGGGRGRGKARIVDDDRDLLAGM